MTYPNTQLFINGQWCDAQDGRTLPVFNPATGSEIGRLAHAGVPDLERAAQAAHKGFELWRDTPANERSAVLRKAAALMRERAPHIAELLTQEQGKPLAEAKVEAMSAADIIEWFAEEGRRVYGRIVPPRHIQVQQQVPNNLWVRWPPSRLGTFPSTRLCARCPPPWPPAAPSSSRPQRKRRLRRPS